MSETPTQPKLFFRNHYTCYKCGKHWNDVWDCQVDDDCPHCGARHCSPVESEELIVSDGTSHIESSCQTETSESQSVFVIVSGGVVQDVICPDGISVVVHDFDVEGVEDEAVVTQGNERFIESVWSANQDEPGEHHS
ncbi:MAG: hypothetical protein CMJ47_01020 [Planctomyces sp.]|nr:hypothetical protein [Planctomyces sp.]